MCITLFTTAHPAYSLILLSNRDEFLNRPTARADWWKPPHENVLGGRDLQRTEKGTWLGITKEGRIASLTNFREEGVEISKDKSRGGIVNAYLTLPPETSEKPEDFAKALIEDFGIYDVGGFSLLFGRFGKAEETDGLELRDLSVVSNRTASPEDIVKIPQPDNDIHGLSNSYYGDLSWPKIVHGEQLLKQAVHGSVKREDGEKIFIEHLFDILSVDTMPKRQEGENWTTYARQLRNSIFIPPVGDEVSGAYGTQKQTVVLVDRMGKVTFVERTLFDENGHRIHDAEAESCFTFNITP
ncbi:hypothetical protein MBLNU230_g2011t1 [Neophaeotheca triangularis]